MKLPLLVSVPHAGLVVPPEAEPFCRLTHEEIVADGDEGAAEAFSLKEHVTQFVTTDVARAIVDLNRSADDFRADGVIKTHTCWEVPVYDPFPPRPVVEQLLDRYYRPYHEVLSKPNMDVQLCIDCHTMAEFGPPIGPDVGVERPIVCLGDANGETMPREWMVTLTECFQNAFNETIGINVPFSGGYITRCHGRERPWVQLELSRSPFITNGEKRSLALLALDNFCKRVF